MAEINHLFSGGRGKMGNLVFYQMNGKTIVRTKPAHFSDKKTPAQLAQRQRMQVINGFLNPFRELIRTTFAAEAEGRSALQAAQSYNMRNALTGEYPDIMVDKNKALLSQGILPLPKSASVAAKPEGLLITWENSDETATATAGDTLLVIALFKAGNCRYQFTEARRADGQYLWKLPQTIDENALPDVWIAFQDRKRTALSPSLYINQ